MFSFFRPSPSKLHRVKNLKKEFKFRGPTIAFYLVRQCELILNIHNGKHKKELNTLLKEYAGKISLPLFNLINMYCYLEKREKEGKNDKDYKDRKEHFFQAIVENKGSSDFYFSLPPATFNARKYCFFEGSQRYYNCAEALARRPISQQDLKDFKTFLGDPIHKKSPFAEELAKKIEEIIPRQGTRETPQNL